MALSERHADGDGRPGEQDPGPHDYDLVVIGSGGAGMAAAIRASELGRTAAVVEGRRWWEERA